MIPQISETWGAAYIQVVVGLLVFFAGLPLLISQLSIDDDIRRIYLRYHRWILLGIALGISILTFISLLWIFHPCPANILPEVKGIILTVMLTVLAVLFIWLYIRFFRQGRETLVLAIENRIMRYVRRRDRGNLGHGVMDALFADMAYLGEFGRAGMEKEVILRVVQRVLTEIGDLRDDDLVIIGGLIDIVSRTILSRQRKCDERNFILAHDILSGLRGRLAQVVSERTENEYIIKSIDRLFRDAGVHCSAMSYRIATQLFINSLGNNPAELFNIGTRMIGQRKLDLAVNCLNHIEFCVESNPDDENARNYLVGLAAHLYDASASARHRVQVALSPLYSDQAERTKLLNSAIQMYLKHPNYATADLIGAL